MLNKKHIITTVAVSSIIFAQISSTSAMMTNVPASTQSGQTTMMTGTAQPMATSAVATSKKIEGVDFIDTNTLMVKLSGVPAISQVDSQVKILEDIKVEKTTKDIDNAKKIVLDLSKDLVDGQKYSIISVGDNLETSIDFTLAGDKSNIVNPALDKNSTGIEKIAVVNPKKVEIYLNKDLKVTSFEFKMFKELSVDSMFMDTTNLNIKLKDALTSSKDYIMIASLKDVSGKEIEIENALYDFVTPELKTPVVSDMTIAEAQTGSLSAPAEAMLTGVTASGTAIEQAAMDAQKTPDTGAKTNILVFLTLILSLGFIVARKKAFKN